MLKVFLVFKLNQPLLAELSLPMILEDAVALLKMKKNGFLVKKGNVTSLAEKLEILLLNSERKSVMANHGPDLVLAKFDSKLVLTQTLKIYHLLYNS